MQRATNIVSSLHSRGVRLWSDNGRLRYEAPKGILQDDDLVRLRTFKTEILSILEETRFAAELPLVPREPGAPLPVTPVEHQTMIWFEKNGKTESERFCTVSVRIDGALQIDALQLAIQYLVARHESLRTRFSKVDGVFRQHVDAAGIVPLEVVILAGMPSDTLEAELSTRAEAFAHEKVVLSAGPLFAAKLFRLSPTEHVLILAIDHILSDGVSLAIIDREVWTLYSQASNGLPFNLPDMRIQLPDYATWQDRMLESWKRDHGPYWKERLVGAPCLQMPREPGLVEAAEPVGAELHFSFGPELSERLIDAGRRERTLPPLVVLTLFFAVMSRWYKQDDLTLLFVGNGRYRPELRDMIGFLADFVYLRVHVNSDDTFRHLLRRVAQEYYTACAHPAYFRAHEVAQVDGLTDMHFNWQPYRWIPWLSHGKWKVNEQLVLKPYPLKKVFAAPFSPFFFQTDAGIGSTVLYRPDQYQLATIQQFFDEMHQFAAAWTAHPLTPLSAIETLGSSSAVFVGN